jgi:O-antigen ligase
MFLKSLLEFLYSKIKFQHLNFLTSILILSYPFERIPSLSIGAGNLRISQVAIILIIYVTAVLLIKRDKQILNLKLTPYLILIYLFIAFSTTSWFGVENFNRFLSTYIATIFTFLATSVIILFSKNNINKIKNLILTVFFTCIFGLYQFIADLINVPTFLTGLREQYTKIVFGFPRIQSTAIEPLYFAGMMYILLFYLIFSLIYRYHSFLPQWFENSIKKLINKSSSQFPIIEKYLWLVCGFCGLLFSGLIFLLTLSKGAWLAFFISFCIFTIINYKPLINTLRPIFQSHQKQIIRFGGSSLLLLFLAFVFVPPFSTFSTTLFNHISETLNGDSATIVERSQFINDALIFLPDKIITGIGSGQYGAYIKSRLSNIDPNATNVDNSFLIVNNVYLEIWLEQGFLALIIFCLFIFLPILQAFKFLKEQRIQAGEHSIEHRVIISTLVYGLLAYYIQWITFSPIFIMPIFILIGLLKAYLRENQIN